jgi:hypothetical protein
MIKSVQTTLGGMKENSQSLKVPKQSWGAWRKIQGIQKFWACKKKKKNQYNDAQNQMKKTKTKRKSPSSTLEGMIDHFGKTFKWQKVKKQAQVILSLEIL